MGVFSTIGSVALNITGSQSGAEATAKIVKSAFDIGVGVDNMVTNHKVIRPMAKKIDTIAADAAAIKCRIGLVMSDTDDIKKRQEAGINLLMENDNKAEGKSKSSKKAKAEKTKAEKAKAKAKKAKANADAAAKKAADAEAEAKKAAEADADTSKK